MTAGALRCRRISRHAPTRRRCVAGWRLASTTLLILVRKLCGDRLDAGHESLETGGPIAFAREMRRHQTGAGHLLETGTRRSISRSGCCTTSESRYRDSRATLRRRSRPNASASASGSPRVPRLQLLAHDADQRVGATTCLAALPQGVLQRTTISSVVVPDNGEPHTGLAPGPQLAGDAPLQIGLALVRHALERQIRKQAWQQTVEKRPHRLLLEEQDKSGHAGSTPSNSRCFQRAPGRSPAAYRSRNSSLSDARRTVANPSFLTNQ